MIGRLLTRINALFESMEPRTEVTDHLTDVCDRMIEIAQKERERDLRR